ncbi:MAG TPA: hypothetical protein PLP61_12370 [Nocardioides sp.]|uniref:hypothetical protein n=1 Tax=Nocardioides sp. TaxID=35761 RepID=UPI002CAAEBC8|nr:hypothetical protein [Nocardioides sp.]HQR27824.1 hypothetical protein [Nocardioides sp.]
MTWEEELFTLFEELEQRAQALYDADRAAELADRSRAAYSSVTLASRWMASVDRTLRMEVAGVGPLTGTLRRVGEGWLLLSGSPADWIVRAAAVRTVRGHSERSVPELAWSPVSGLGLGSALRRLAESGERCVLHLVDGSRYDGVLGRIGADFAELVCADAQVLVGFDGLAAVQSRE